MKLLKNFKITERISRQTIKVLLIQFGDDEVTRRIAIYLQDVWFVSIKKNNKNWLINECSFSIPF